MVWEPTGVPPADEVGRDPSDDYHDAEAITRLIEGAQAGDPKASSALLDAVYAHLRAIAAVRMAGERKGHTLQPTALVHEVYAKLFGGGPREYKDRGHFFAAAALAMERILISHARWRQAGASAGPGAEADGRPAPARQGPRSPGRMPVSVLELSERDDPEEILAVHEALERFQGVDARAAHVVRLRFFGGLSVAETALAMDLSVRTVEREWEYARTWLLERILALRSDEVRRGAAGGSVP